MKKKDMAERIRVLERRIAELEERTPQISYEPRWIHKEPQRTDRRGMYQLHDSTGQVVYNSRFDFTPGQERHLAALQERVI